MKYTTQISNSTFRIPKKKQRIPASELEFRIWNLSFFIILLLTCLACKQEQATEEVYANKVAVKQSNTLAISRPLYQSPTFLSDATGKTIQITADSTSYDEHFGDSYRVLRILAEVNDTEKELSRRLLPVNYSPDFRYNFADVYAKNKQEWVVIQGNYFFFVYDVINDHLSKKIFPPKPSNYEAIDAQSGRIITLAFEGYQLKGKAQDIGIFQFSIAQLRQAMQQ